MRRRGRYIGLHKTISLSDVFSFPFLSSFLFFLLSSYLSWGFTHCIILTKACSDIFNGFKVAYETAPTSIGKEWLK